MKGDTVTVKVNGVCVNEARPDGTACDVETLLIAASAYNPGCAVTGMVPPAPCFVQGGGVGEYSILPEEADGQPEFDEDTEEWVHTVSCTGVQNPGEGGGPGSYGPGGANEGCAQPIATFLGRFNETGSEDLVDPRMLMVIHEAFVQ